MKLTMVGRMIKIKMVLLLSDPVIFLNDRFLSK